MWDKIFMAGLALVATMPLWVLAIYQLTLKDEEGEK